ncbi:MAG: Maf family nucleotide pyrophosphatase [Clostridium sp.]|nr:Maf family nucleotide pyrophosphatase [Bacteroides sp.]MCM1198505.1 Maf family nucleotide pyrophosphatase [Clostridium sp.]
MFKGKKIILASNSPRRKELLAGLNIDFEVDTRNNFEEKFSKGLPHESIPAAMSEGKSWGFHRELEEDEILITSDTMVLCGTEVMGKPHSREEAVRMLRLLSGRSHKVITAVTIRDSHRQKTLSDTAIVHFRELTDNEINFYIDNYRPFDKAGAYGIQEWIGYVGITGIEGSYYTIMGFPVHIVYQLLLEFI